MNQTVTIGIFFLVLMSLVVFVPDVIAHSAQYIKANEAADYVTKLAETEGGVNSSVQSEASSKLQQLGLDPGIFKFTYSSTGQLNFQQKVSVTLDGSYTYHAFNLLGTGLGLYKAPIHIVKTGYSDVYYR